MTAKGLRFRRLAVTSDILRFQVSRALRRNRFRSVVPGRRIVVVNGRFDRGRRRRVFHGVIGNVAGGIVTNTIVGGVDITDFTVVAGFGVIGNLVDGRLIQGRLVMKTINFSRNMAAIADLPIRP